MKTNLQKNTGHQGERPKPMERIAAFLTRNRKIFVYSLGVVVAAVLVLVVLLSIQSNRNEAALGQAEAIVRQYNDWAALDADKQTAQYEDLSKSVTALIEKYPQTYSSIRARMVNGQALMVLKRYSEAAEQFVEIADKKKDTYLAPVALMSAAIALEDAQDTDRALELYNRLADNYKDKSIDVPRAILAIGRIHEQRDEITDAAAAYKRLVDDYPASSWTNLARNRIISLTVQGRIGG